MQAATLIVVFGLTAVVASPVGDLKIVGGQVAVINQYPSAVALLHSSNGVVFSQSCAGTILTTRSVLTACHCVYGDIAARWRVRAGSTMANSGGSVYALSSLMYHPSFSIITMDSDVAIMRTSSPIVYGNLAQPAVISGSTYTLADNQVVWAVGWGTTAAGDAVSNQLRHVQIWTVNQNNCASRYNSIGVHITANMLCAGWLDVGGRDQCSGDSGGPLYHNGVLVGVCSFGYGCASAVYPGVNARVSKLASWIQSNAKS